MRLLYLNPLAQMGGAERALLEILEIVRRAEPSWPIGLLLGQDGPLASDAARLGVDVRVLPFPTQYAQLGDAGLAMSAAAPTASLRFVGRAVGGSVSMLRYLSRLRREIGRFKPDIVHSNGMKMHLLGAAAKPSRAALVWHLHDYVGTRPVTLRLLRRLQSRCDAVAAVSESIAGDARAHLDVPMFVTLGNAVNMARFAPDGPALDLDWMAGLPPAAAGTVRVGLVATFAKWKGHLTFLEALRHVVDRHEVRGYIVGGPLYETQGSQCTLEELRGAARQFGIEHAVGFTGFVDDTAAALRALDVVVHASTEPEPFGLVIAEAMACGRAIVISAAGGARELVEPEGSGLVHRPGDATMLAAQIARLVNDAALRRRLGTAARAAAIEQFSPARMSARVLPLYGAVAKPLAA